MSESKSTLQQNRTIVASFVQEKYPETLENSKLFRIALKKLIDAFPELFPTEIKNGYQMKDIRYSKKSGISTRRIVIGSVAYTVRPSFIMPYHTAFTNDVEKVLFLRKFEVPYWGLSCVFGKNSMYWYRHGAKSWQKQSMPFCRHYAIFMDRCIPLLTHVFRFCIVTAVEHECMAFDNRCCRPIISTEPEQF